MATGAQRIAERPRARWGLAPPFDRLLATWIKIAVALLAIGGVYALRAKPPGAEGFFFWNQDAPVLAAMLALVAALGVAPPSLLARLSLPKGRAALAGVLGLAAACLVCGAVGARLVFGGYAFALDEFLANFDARIFASGHIVAHVPRAWQPFVPALQPMYMLPMPDNRVWASDYLPVNAAMRALGLRLGTESLVNPLLSAFSVLAVWRIGLRLWPQEPRLALIAAALLGTAPQLVVMSMTAYAMPGHLAFNLAWLWLFLRGDRLGHVGAVIVGFLATGLHQIVFHPLFVGPFILQLWLDRRWRLAAFYTLAYAVICGFWVEYWRIFLPMAGVAGYGAGAVGGGWVLDRLALLLSVVRIDNLGLMAEGLMRFVTWQNPLTLPLAVAGALAAERAKGHLRALALGVVLTLLLMLIVEPTQVHGWGYRYAHGLLGSVCLLAAWTWGWMTKGLSPERGAAASGALVIACAVSLLALLPLRTWQAWSYTRPYAAADAEIRAAPARVVIVDQEGAPGFDPGTVVRNDPFLRNRPKVMELAYMDANLVRAVCAKGGVEVFTGRDGAALGMDVIASRPQPQVVALRSLMKQLRCGAPIR